MKALLLAGYAVLVTALASLLVFGSLEDECPCRVEDCDCVGFDDVDGEV